MEAVRLSKEEVDRAEALGMTLPDYARHKEEVLAVSTIAEAFMLHRRGKSISDRDWNAAEATLEELRKSGWRNRLG